MDYRPRDNFKRFFERTLSVVEILYDDSSEIDHPKRVTGKMTFHPSAIYRTPAGETEGIPRSFDRPAGDIL